MFPRIAEMSKSGYFYPGLGAASGLIGAGPETNMPEKKNTMAPLVDLITTQISIVGVYGQAVLWIQSLLVAWRLVV
jgi:hypothetical protein